MSIRLIPKVGLDNSLFGSSHDLILREFGIPLERHSIDDFKGYPRSRLVLTYADKELLVTPKLGLISVSVGTEETEIVLLDKVVNQMSVAEFTDLLSENKCDFEITPEDGWGNRDIFAKEFGILASFQEDSLLDVEIHSHT